MPPRLTRRATLTAAASGLTALAGCSTFDGDGDGDDRMEFALDQLTALNDDSVPHTLHLQVAYDGEPIFWQSYDLGTQGDSSNPPARLLVEHDWPAEPGRYAIRARVDHAATWETFTSVNSRECAELDVHITEDASLAALSLASCPDE